jgi:uncharacterized protein YbjT (DUF2867 family)
MYTILGATGNIGSVIARTLLEKGEKVRVFGRSPERLKEFAGKGAEVQVGDIADANALTKALTGVRAAFLLLPPDMQSKDYRAHQSEVIEALTTAVKNSGLQYAVNLSSIGAQAPSGTGPIAGLHESESKLNAIAKLNVLHLRPAWFMENELRAIPMIQGMGLYGGALKADLKLSMIATKDIGAYAAKRLLKLEFSGKQTQELLGERDVTMKEVAVALGAAIGKPDLGYTEFRYEQVQQALLQMGLSDKTAALFVEMFRGFNEHTAVRLEKRSPENTTPTSIEAFAKEVFAPAYSAGKAAASGNAR